jgi:hypothetical protein
MEYECREAFSPSINEYFDKILPKLMEFLAWYHDTFLNLWMTSGKKFSER